MLQCTGPVFRACLILIDAIYARGARAFFQSRFQRAHFVFRPGSEALNRRVLVVAHPTCEAELVCFTFHKPAETHALHTTSHDEALRCES